MLCPARNLPKKPILRALGGLATPTIGFLDRFRTRGAKFRPNPSLGRSIDAFDDVLGGSADLTGGSAEASEACPLEKPIRGRNLGDHCVGSEKCGGSATLRSASSEPRPSCLRR